MKVKEETVLEKAVVELTQITEAANKNAMEKLSKKMPEDFDKLLKEELTKIKEKKESVKESIVDEKKEPVTEGKEKAGDNKESLNEVENVDLRESTFESVESAFDGAQKDSEFNVSPDENLMMKDIEEELSKMQGLANDVDTSIHEMEVEDPMEKFKALYGEMSTIMDKMEQDKMQTEMNNKFNDHMNTAFGETYEADLGSDQIGQLKEMFAARQKGEPFEKAATVNEDVEDVEKVDEMHKGNFDADKHNANLIPQTIAEDEEGTEEDKREDDDVVDETATSSKGHAANRTVGNENMPKSSPRKDSTQRQFQREGLEKRYAVQKQNWEKRMNSLLIENKSITKAFNAGKVSAIKMTEFITEATDAISKYRAQLGDMSVFNTNLAYSNSILIDESIALTAEDKKLIVSEFKNVASITESEKKYKTLLEGFKGTEKKTMNENLEDKVNDTIEPSSSQTIVEQVNEQTAYGGAKGQIDKILKNINYQRQ